MTKPPSGRERSIVALTLSLLGSITGAALTVTALWAIGRPAAIDPALDPVPQTR